jgi:hypothetical protein
LPDWFNRPGFRLGFSPFDVNIVRLVPRLFAGLASPVR